MFSILPRKRSPVLLRKSLLRGAPAVALACLGSSIALIATFSSQNAETTSLKVQVGLVVFVMFSLFPLLVFIHHMFRLWRWRYWLTIFELIISMGEVAGFILLIRKAWIEVDEADSANDLDANFAANSPGLPWLYPGSFILLAVLSLLSLITMVWDIMSGRLIDLLKPYHCLADEPRPGWAVLVGVSAMKERFSTDKHWLVLFRGVTAALAVLAVILAGIWMILGQPLNQISGSVEIRTFYNAAIATGIVPMHHKFVNLLVGFQDNSIKRLGLNWTEVVDQSLNVTIISQEIVEGSLRINQNSLSCNPAMPTDEVLLHASVYCPLNLDPAAHIMKITYFVLFDFSLLTPGSSNGTLPPELWASVYLGFSESPLDVYLNTVPVYLFPGSRILGQAEMIYRDMLEDSNMVILGLPSYRRILVARVYSWPVEDDGMIPLLNNNTGATKISPLLVNPVRYERDFLEKSIFGSFATLGGVWTFLNGIFAIVFGTTLCLILFDQKPLSIYGLIHTVLRDDVAHIRDERPISLEEQQRIIGLLRRHLLDLPQEKQQTGEATDSKTDFDLTTEQLLPKYIGGMAITPLSDEEMEMHTYAKPPQR